MSAVSKILQRLSSNSQIESDHPVAKDRFAIVIGSGLRGKLGVGYTKHLTSLTKHDELPDGMLYMQCGEHHAVSLTDSTQICTWGSNEFGQLGYDTRTHLFLTC
jgi:alpha-tubulin suppressor-like RCC1 family protein